MKVRKSFIIKIIKKQINLLSEGKTLSSANMRELKELCKKLKLSLTFASPDHSAISYMLYKYIVHYHDTYDEVMNIRKDPEKKKKIDDWYSSIQDSLKKIGEARSWEIIDNGNWFQLTKPFTGDPKHGEGNYKRYITFKRGAEYYENLGKLGLLLNNLNSKKTKGKVSFKISSFFLPGYNHKDSVVIYYKDKEDEKAVAEAVSETGFNVISRTDVGRLDLGRDKDGKSDSQLVADKVADALIKQKDKIMVYLNEPEDSDKFKQAMSAVDNLIDIVMNSSSHRD